MPSNSIDSNQNVGYTFTVDNPTTTNPVYPSIYADSIDDNGNPESAPTLVQTGSAAVTDTANHSWGEYFSMSIDPSNSQKFWGIGEYFTSSESTCHPGDKDGCNWLTAIFSCTKGSGC